MKQLPQIPGYSIKSKLGQGGMADVYLGIQEKLARQVAIKILDPLLLRDDQFAKRFIKEAQTAAQLAHPNIITIHDVGMEQDREFHYYYIVMEYLAESLSDRLKQRGPLPAGEALDIVKKIAGALDYAHKQGFIHRDIKPDNIMFRFDGSVVLVDFGIARAMDSTTQLTRTGMSIGTPHYMSPEQCKGEKTDGRSDIYSLGVQLYEILTGDVPYKAESTAGIIIKHIQEPIPTLPAPLSMYQPLIDKMMAKDRDLRIQSGAELVHVIDAMITARDSMPQRPMTEPVVATTVVDIEVEQERPTIPTPAPAAVPVPAPTPTSAPTVPETVSDKSKGKQWLLPGILAALLLILAGTVIVLLISGPGESDKTNTTAKTVAQDVKQQAEETEDKKEQPTEADEVKEKETGKDTDTDAGTTDTGKTDVTAKEEIKIQKTPGKSKPPVETKKKTVKTATLLELPLRTRINYNQRIKKIQIIIRRRARFQVYGHISVELNVDQWGKVTVGSLDETLTVNPERARGPVLDIIRKQLSDISLQPPRDKQGNPVKFQWRLTYKVGKFMNKIILTKQ